MNEYNQGGFLLLTGLKWIIATNLYSTEIDWEVQKSCPTSHEVISGGCRDAAQGDGNSLSEGESKGGWGDEGEGDSLSEGNFTIEMAFHSVAYIRGLLYLRYRLDYFFTYLAWNIYIVYNYTKFRRMHKLPPFFGPNIYAAASCQNKQSGWMSSRHPLSLELKLFMWQNQLITICILNLISRSNQKVLLSI